MPKESLDDPGVILTLECPASFPLSCPRAQPSVLPRLRQLNYRRSNWEPLGCPLYFAHVELMCLPHQGRCAYQR
jgi:hypothetical protein